MRSMPLIFIITTSFHAINFCSDSNPGFFTTVKNATIELITDQRFILAAGSFLVGYQLAMTNEH